MHVYVIKYNANVTYRAVNKPRELAQIAELAPNAAVAPGEGHGDGPQKNDASCLESLGCWGVGIVVLIALIAFGNATKLLETEYFIIISLVIAAVAGLSFAFSISKKKK